MLTQFSAIIDEIVRGAEQLRESLVRAETALAHTAASFANRDVGRAFTGGSVLNLDRLREPNARDVTRALAGEVAGSASAAQSLRDQLRRLEPSVDRIARNLAESVRSRSGKQQGGVSRRTSSAPRREDVGRRGGSFLRTILQSRRGRVLRWRWERSRSPLRRYVGQSLSRYAERGNLRRMFIELSRAPTAMRSGEAVGAAGRAGISAGQLARGAQAVGMIGRLGTAFAAAGSAAGPIGVGIAAFVVVTAATLKAAAALIRFVRAQDEAVFAIRRTVEEYARVHAGMALLAARFEVARIGEAHRMGDKTFMTTSLYAGAAERYRRQGEDLRALGRNLSNLMGYAQLQVAYLIKVATGIRALEQLSGPLNQMIEAVMLWLGVTPDKTAAPYQDWLRPYLRGRVPLGGRRPPRAPFNPGPR